MSSCRWCEGSRKHKEDCPSKDESLKTVVKKGEGGWVETYDEEVYQG